MQDECMKMATRIYRLHNLDAHKQAASFDRNVVIPVEAEQNADSNRQVLRHVPKEESGRFNLRQLAGVEDVHQVLKVAADIARISGPRWFQQLVHAAWPRSILRIALQVVDPLAPI